MPKFSNKALVQLSISGAVGTLDFSAFPFFDIRNLYAVVDQTAGVPLYLQGVSGYGYSALTGRLMTLQAPMSGTGPPAFTVATTDTFCVTYDEGDDFAANLYWLFSGLPDIVNGQPHALTGALVNDQIGHDLLRKIYAALLVLCRLSIVDKAVSDSDVESLLNDELNNFGS